MGEASPFHPPGYATGKSNASSETIIDQAHTNTKMTVFRASTSSAVALDRAP